MAKKKIEQFIADNTPRRIKHQDFTFYDFPCKAKLGDVISYLEAKQKEYGEDATLIIEMYDYDELHISIQTFRDETPEEIEKRIAKAKRDKERSAIQRAKRKEREEEDKKKKELAEIQLLKKLKEKYEGYTFEQVT